MIGRDQFERGVGALEDDLAPVFEIHGDAPANHRLDLAQPPLRLVPMADDRTHFEQKLHHCSRVTDTAR